MKSKCGHETKRIHDTKRIDETKRQCALLSAFIKESLSSVSRSRPTALAVSFGPLTPLFTVDAVTLRAGLEDQVKLIGVNGRRAGQRA